MTDSRHPLVLIVDDDLDTRELYRMVLESVGYRVEDVGLVQRAIAAVSAQVPDVVLTDWLLPIRVSAEQEAVGLDLSQHGEFMELEPMRQFGHFD